MNEKQRYVVSVYMKQSGMKKLKEKKLPEAKAWVSLTPIGIIGTATRFKNGMYFEVTGTRGNKWLFSIDEVLELAKTSKDKDKLTFAKMIERDVNSDVGLNVGFPLATLIDNCAKEFGDDAVVKLNRNNDNVDDRVKE